MSRKARHRHILDKAKGAAIAAISCYNQPNFSYREENFCILMVNAWELLLKAKIVKEHNENIQSIYVVDTDAKRKDGKPFAKPKYRKNKAGNFITIGFKKIIDQSKPNNITLDKTLVKQLETLYELRNTFIHLAGSCLQKTALEIFTATLQSFKLLCEQWFDEKVTDNLMLIPLAFDLPNNFSSDVSNEEAEKLLTFISNQEKSLGDNPEHNIRVSVEVKVVRAKQGLPVNLGSNGITVKIDSEEQFKKKYHWTYKDDLVPELKKKYPDFKPNQKFYEAMRELKKDPSYCGERHLDWNKKQGPRKWFYSPTIIQAIAKKLGLLRNK